LLCESKLGSAVIRIESSQIYHSVEYRNAIRRRFCVFSVSEGIPIGWNNLAQSDVFKTGRSSVARFPNLNSQFNAETDTNPEMKTHHTQKCFLMPRNFFLKWCNNNINNLGVRSFFPGHKQSCSEEKILVGRKKSCDMKKK